MFVMCPKPMKSIGEIEEDLANKAEPVLGIKPSSTLKRGPIGLFIYVVCGIAAFFSLRSAGVFCYVSKGLSTYPHTIFATRSGCLLHH